MNISKIASKIVFTMVVVLLIVTTNLNAHEWTATSGHKLIGDFVELKDGTVSIQLPDGKIADVPLVQLCDDDKEFVKQETTKKDSPFTIRDNQSAQAAGENPHAPQATTDQNAIKYSSHTPLDELQTAADKENAEACYELGIRFYDGYNGCKKDESKGDEYMQKGAKEDSPAGWVCKAMCYGFGIGVKSNANEGIKWFRKAAENENAVAQHRLGIIYYSGKGVAMNKDEAAMWFRKSAEQGYSAGQFNLGVCYANHNMTIYDDKEAVKWFHKAAEQEHADAQHRLGWCYKDGKGVEKNEEEAMKWCRKAETNGQRNAKFMVEQIQADAAGKVMKATIAQAVADLPQTKLPFVEIRLGEDENIVCFSPDERFFATVDHQNEGGSRTLSRIWDRVSGKNIHTLPGDGPVFSPDGKYIATLWQSWDTNEYRQRLDRWKRANPREARQGIIVESFAWLKIYDAQTGREIRKMQEIENATFAFAEGGKSYMIDGYLWNTATGNRGRKLEGASEFGTSKELTDVIAAQSPKMETDWRNGIEKVFSLDDRLYAASNKEAMTAVLFESGTAKPLYKWENANSPFFSPNRRFLILGVGDKEGDYRIYDLRPEENEN